MEQTSQSILSFDDPIKDFSEEVIEKNFRVYFNNRIRRRHSSFNYIEIQFQTYKSVFDDCWKDLFMYCVKAMYDVSNKHFHFYLPSVKVIIKIILVEIKEGSSHIRIRCKNELRDSIVRNPYKTRASEVEESIDNEYDNIHQLNGMGLKLRADDKMAIMEVLWQFEGKAKEENCESLRLEIKGGNRDYVFGNNNSKIYSILRLQDHFILRATDDQDASSNKTDIVRIDLKDISGDLIEGKFDFSLNQWTYRICKDVIIDGETYFGTNNDTWNILEKPITITVGGASIRIQSKGGVTRHRKILSWL